MSWLQKLSTFALLGSITANGTNPLIMNTTVDMATSTEVNQQYFK